MRIADEQLGEVTERINEILTMVEQLQAIDTTQVEPLANPLDATQQLRADEVTEIDRREELLEVAPLTENGLFLVPKVIE